MREHLLYIVGAFIVWTQPAVDSARVILHEAQRAVEADSVNRLRGRWEARLRQRPGDEGATLGLATLARLTYDYPAAERHYGALVAAPAARASFATYARIGQAQVMEARRQLAPADSLYVRAASSARAAGDSAGEAAVLLNLFSVRLNTIGANQARPLLDSAASLIPVSAPELRAQYHCARAAVLVTTGQLADVGAEVAAGITAARQAGSGTIEARCMAGDARAARARGQLDSARAILDRAAALQRRVHDQHGLARTLLYAAQLSMLQGRYGDARQTMEQALQLADRSSDSASIGSAYLGLADVALSVKDHPAAATHLFRAIAMFEQQGDRDRATVARVWQAQLSADIGDLSEARRQTREVLQWYEQSGNVEGQGVQYRALAMWATRARDWTAAVDALRSASELARRHDLKLLSTKLIYDEAQLARARGDFAAAERGYDAYLRTLAPDAHVQRYETQMRLAEIHARRGEIARAEQLLQAASEDLDQWRATLGDAALRILAFQATSSEASDVGSSIASALAALATKGRAAAAFEIAERRRARELANRIVRAQALSTGIAEAASEPAGRSQQLAASLTAAEVVAALPDDSTAIVEYVTGAGAAPTVAFVVSRAGVRAHVMPPIDSLTPQVTRFATLVESGAPERALGRALGAALLDSALASLGSAVTRLVVVPDGVLHRVPFDALRLAGGQYAVERFAISMAPSASVVTGLWGGEAARRSRLAASTGTARLLALGDPAFAREIAAATDRSGESYRSAFDAAGGLPRLVGSGREVREVARYAPGAVVRLRSRATESYVKRAPLDSFQILHFATHALVDDRTIARTAIALAPGGGEDGFLTPGELASLTLHADLVVLSACRTAGGVVVAGEGVQGLTAPLLQAGARAVMATGWRIGDQAAVDFVDGLYHHLANGLSASEALRAAKLAAIRRGAPSSEWAAFTIVGDPLVSIPLAEPAPLSRWWWLGALVPVGALTVRRGRARRRQLPTATS